jgi:uncharacterized protein
MPVDHIRYDILTQQALRRVVRSVLVDAAKNGLPGEHHFKITFATGAPGVRLSEGMRTQYPEAMTIILQHQFWDLVVGEDSFEVGLSFGGVPERLVIPFDAVTAFYDPAVQFGFQFETIETESGGKAATDNQPPDRVSELEALPMPGPAPAKSAESASKPDSGGEPGAGAEIVRLDRFRKK